MRRRTGWRAPGARASRLALVACVAAVLAAGCSPKRYAVNTIGQMLAAGDSVYASDDDIVLIGEALPSSLKMIEGLLAESPEHTGLLLTASRGFVLYAYAYVHFDADEIARDDLEAARALRLRARKLYLRAHGYALRALNVSYPGFDRSLRDEPRAAVDRIGERRVERDVSGLYWAAASLGLAIAVSKSDVTLLARLEEVEALLQRALELDEGWGEGALHEFFITWAATRRPRLARTQISSHYERALELSRGTRAALFVAYAEAVALPEQDRAAFERLLERALAVDADANPGNRLLNAVARRRATWLREHIDELFL